MAEGGRSYILYGARQGRIDSGNGVFRLRHGLDGEIEAGGDADRPSAVHRGDGVVDQVANHHLEYRFRLLDEVKLRRAHRHVEMRAELREILGNEAFEALPTGAEHWRLVAIAEHDRSRIPSNDAAPSGK